MKNITIRYKTLRTGVKLCYITNLKTRKTFIRIAENQQQ